MESKTQKLLFIINPGSGDGEIDYQAEIAEHFKNGKANAECYKLPADCSLEKLKTAIKKSKADRVIAVGGDGTLKLVAECLIGTDKPIGVIPAGSANGMAKELGIPQDLKEALDLCAAGTLKKIHAVKLNDQLCIHLSDIGFNAFLVKKFDELPERGMKTYAKAAWHAFWNHKKMDITLKVDGKTIKEKAAMVAIANATKYGTGLQINPDGKLDDDLFEVIVVKEYAVMEILKIWISKLPWNPKKIESYQVSELEIKTKHKVHFQVDGEYLGKVDQVKASILTEALTIIV